VTIPAQIRQELGLAPGSRLVAYVEGGRLVLEERRHLLARIQDVVAREAEAAGATGSAVDELIDDRRSAAGREAGEFSR
jgi:AbrB family looped-hinge helix DNA binding protein